MKFQSEEHSSSSATVSQSHVNWLRLISWFGVGLAHAVILGAVLHASPSTLGMTAPNVIHASLIAPRLLDASLEFSFAQQSQEEQPEPPKTPPPEKPKPIRKILPPQIPETPKNLLVAASIGEDMPAPAYEVAAPPADPPQGVSAAMGSASAGHSSAGDSDSNALVLPIFNADYLDNPKPPYPQLSRRYGETGRVLLRVYVSANGRAERVEIATSSGFERLDTAARNAVYAWRFVPARRGSERVAAWVIIPLVFNLM